MTPNTFESLLTVKCGIKPKLYKIDILTIFNIVHVLTNISVHSITTILVSAVADSDSFKVLVSISILSYHTLLGIYFQNLIVHSKMSQGPPCLAVVTVIG